MQVFRHALALSVMGLASILLIACATSNPNSFRVLTAITVTPNKAIASDYTNGQVTFTATGQFNVPPLSGPVTFTSPYTGQFIVANPTGQTVANIVSTGTGTITVQCVSGVSATVGIVATAAANNGTQTTVTGNSQLTCP